MTSGEMVRGLQQRAARAFPAEQVEDADGWWLRHAPGCAWWVGPVLPHGDAEPGELVRRVVRAEAFYRDRGAAAGFQITPSGCAEGLDDLLAARGYHRHGLVSLQMASTTRVKEATGLAALVSTGSLRVRLDDRATSDWLEVWGAVHGHGADLAAERDMLARVEPPSLYASAMIGEEVVAVGRSVVDTGWAGVFGMATLPGARGSGAATTVLGALAKWAAAHDAEHMYLQVERDNVVALHLYERRGFTEICRYHYRMTR